MRIIEVRDGFIKIETDEKISLSSFLQINDLDKNYIAQVVQVKNAGSHSVIYAKLIFLYDGTFQIYDKTLPSKDAKIIPFGFDVFSKSFECKKPIITGSFIENEIDIPLDEEYFNKQLLISIDSPDNNNLVVSNLAKQFKKSLIIDTLGVINSKKYVAGVDFKLPLNTDSLEFMFEDCLNDATSDSKSLIKEIFQDLSDYSKTVPFLPFGALKTIVDDMVDKSHVFKLLVLKNKLAKFEKMGYFASTIEEAENLNKILNSNNAVLDLSKLDSTFLNRYLSIIFSTLEKQNLEPQIFVEASNLLDKKNLKRILTGANSTTFITHSRFKYIKEIKSMFKNFIVEPSFTSNEVFKGFSAILSAMSKNTYLIIGESTGYIPLVSLVQEYVPVDNEVVVQEEVEQQQQLNIEENSDDIEENLVEELDSENIIDLEEEFECETSVAENVSDEIDSVEVIEKKSDDLIEKISEEVQTESIHDSMNIFGEESSDNNEENVEEYLVQEDLIDESNEMDELIESSDEELLDNTISPEVIAEEDSLDSVVDEEIIQPELIESDLEKSELINEVEQEVVEPEFHTEIDEVQTIEIPEDISDLTEDAEEFNLEESIPELPEVKSDESETQEEIPEVMPLASDDEEFEEIVELDEAEDLGDAIVVDFEDEEPLDADELDKAIVEDVDKVFTTMKDDSISDSDLDFIDELNSNDEEEPITLSDGMEELAELAESDDVEDGFLEPLEEVSDFVEESEEKEILETRNTSTPIVPVYGADIPAEDIVVSDTIEQGDSVVHAKYGNGVVEKMIKYGTKTLYSINFDNVGRRLLDPTLTEIKKN